MLNLLLILFFLTQVHAKCDVPPDTLIREFFKGPKLNATYVIRVPVEPNPERCSENALCFAGGKLIPRWSDSHEKCVLHLKGQGRLENGFFVSEVKWAAFNVVKHDSSGNQPIAIGIGFWGDKDLDEEGVRASLISCVSMPYDAVFRDLEKYLGPFEFLKK